MASDPVEWDRERVHIWIVVGCSKVNRAVGSSAVVVDGVLLQHGAQMSFPGNEHPVGAFGPGGEDPALREGIRSWALGRDLERFDAFAGERRVEGVGELAVAVADQEAQLAGPLPEISDEIAGQLRRPGRGWMRGNAQDVDVAVAGIQDEEYVDTLEGSRNRRGRNRTPEACLREGSCARSGRRLFAARAAGGERAGCCGSSRRRPGAPGGAARLGSADIPTTCSRWPVARSGLSGRRRSVASPVLGAGAICGGPDGDATAGRCRE